MQLTYLKNPIILGILAAVITYLYFYWDAEKRYKKDPKIKRKPVSILTPGVIGVVVWFLSSCYFDKSTSSPQLGNGAEFSDSFEPENVASVNKPAVSRYKLVGAPGSAESSINSRSYHLIGKNKVRLPPTDVFLDIAKF